MAAWRNSNRTATSAAATDLVDHHDAEEHAEGEEEESVDVVLDRVTHSDRERKQDDTADREEADSEKDVSDDL